MITKKMKLRCSIYELFTVDIHWHKMGDTFLFLHAGSNWSTMDHMTSGDERLFPYDSVSLQEEITRQLQDRHMNTGMFAYSKSLGSIKFDEKIDFRITEEKMDRMQMFLADEKIHPIITFHGTNIEKAESIFENGYLIPGCAKNKVKVRVANGQVYGPGVYTTLFHGMAARYARPDGTSYSYVLVNLIFPGKFKLIPDKPTGTREPVPTDGVFKDGTNTKIIFGLSQFICADPDRVVPLALMAIK